MFNNNCQLRDLPKGKPAATADDLSGVNAILQHLRTDLDELTANFYAALEEQGIGDNLYSYCSTTFDSIST